MKDVRCVRRGGKGPPVYRNHLPYPTIFAPAIEKRGQALILLHNHPSGNPEPSTQDLKITKRLIEVGEIVGITVLDHIIIGSDNYYSFADDEKI